MALHVQRGRLNGTHLRSAFITRLCHKTEFQARRSAELWSGRQCSLAYGYADAQPKKGLAKQNNEAYVRFLAEHGRHVRGPKSQQLQPTALAKVRAGVFTGSPGACILPSSSHTVLCAIGSSKATSQMRGLADTRAAVVPDDAFSRIVLPTALALLLCNMDRIVMSVAILPIAQEFEWSPSMQGIVQSAFLWGYLGTNVLGGRLADSHGGKVVMAYSIAFFSLASTLLPIALSHKVAALGLSLPAMLAARVCVGLGEGAALPVMNNLVATNISPTKRATALGTCFSGFHTGNLVGLALAPFLLQRVGWRGLFYVFGLLGAPLLVFWLATVPQQTPQVMQGPGRPPKLSPIEMMSKTATWAIIVVNFVNHWGYFIYLNWLPSYFNKVLGVNLRSSAFLAFLPWAVMAIGCSVAGFIADRQVAAGVPPTRVRKRIQTLALLGPAVALLVLSSAKRMSTGVAVACMTAALAFKSLGQAGFVANMSEIAPQHAGQMFGLCNTWGSLAGIVGTASVGFIFELTGSFNAVFQATAAIYIAATIFWNLFCTSEPQFDRLVAA